MGVLKRVRALSDRQWLGLDAGGSFLIGCGIFFRTIAFMEDEPAGRIEALSDLYVFLLYLLPACSLLGLAALLLWGAMGKKGGKPSRLLAFFGSVPHILVGLLHFCLWGGSTDVPLNGLAGLALGVGAAGIFWAVFARRESHR